MRLKLSRNIDHCNLGLSQRDISWKTFLFCIESWKNIQKAKKIHNPFVLFQQKRQGEVKNEQILDVLIYSTILKESFLPHCPQRSISGDT